MNILEDIYCYILEYIGGYLMFTFLDYIGGYLLLNSWIYWRIFNVYNSWIYCLHFMNLFEDIGKKNEQNWCWENSWFAGSRQVNKKSIQKQRKQTHVYQQTNASMPTNKHLHVNKQTLSYQQQKLYANKQTLLYQQTNMKSKIK